MQNHEMSEAVKHVLGIAETMSTENLKIILEAIEGKLQNNAPSAELSKAASVPHHKDQTKK